MSAGLWVTMTRAPRDGSVILLFNADQQSVEAGYWNPVMRGFEVSLGDIWQASECPLWMPMPYPDEELIHAVAKARA